MSPFQPKPKLQPLPPTLRIQKICSISSYGKASRVFSSICTYPASSPVLYFHRAGPRDSSPVITPFVRVGTYPTRNFALLLLRRTLSLPTSLEVRVLDAGLSLAKF